MAQPTSSFPKKEVFGFLSSIVMTILAIIVAFRTNLSTGAIMAIIGTLALLQAGLQLIMFMHVTEGKDGKANIVNMVYSFFLAAVIVFGSIWILTSGHMAH
ncbi:cytochrome aa3 quinol oxidase subunit IV [Anaerobacillus alkalidiazotrophicus]|uniref:Quinol oxidase subunit 4 n=1 Tax=Anaerobacillus alkalidiazotrophicus TaxID=472963 RepID=A0A1S2M358_9BACI|nr:cytochrome aa3 quinol oxidase subunit IV [Anaerobacillus alkalidiazotrophicus]OIJ18873.1 cytochrome aa3 quinol oxidase subunit IV [Anaerobacillus alkalidiazotrophicus]